ncbi:hypothetical protein SODALDRAFT_361493 [Sodiomyces alkalinus F11]|uniref:Uncharacterized protein n=1 Tax=Sodiomyces alkalinus (strain CBS 110278 / VKM F-3762 / F11) TaxID=1314773 RepID=A0A3N2PQG5_SODAK|nr:hypothetical protein SODALDRAFT_361493 [Sodiomyces alkalinus F11]ROT36680.1 hypothetical protein SODALDRAFT_361493 [Sodiomyces alkalinus F11]
MDQASNPFRVEQQSAGIKWLPMSPLPSRRVCRYPNLTTPRLGLIPTIAMPNIRCTASAKHSCTL